MDDLLRRVQQATFAGWRAEAAAHPGGETVEIDGLLCHTTAIPVRHWNGVHVMRRPVDPLSALPASMAWFHARGLAYALLLPVADVAALSPTCRRVGLRPFKIQPVMALRPAEFRSAVVPPELVVRTATDAAGTADVVRLGAACFGDPPAELTRFVSPTIGHPHWTLLVGYVAGTAVATATLMRQPGAAGIYGVATLPAYQRRGYGAALTSVAVTRGLSDLAGEPVRIAHLNPSDAAAGIYARMGFRPLPGWAIWAGGE